MSNQSGIKSEMNPSKIIGIQFSILSPDEIRKSSVAHITSRDTYINNKPVINGLFDPRMGVIEPGIICPTDGLNYMETPGYFGHIDLARPVYYIQYLKHILKILRCVCFKCSKLLINKNLHKHVLELPSNKRWEYVFEFASGITRCGDENEDGCGCKQPSKIKKEGLATIMVEWDIKDDEEGSNSNLSLKLTPEMVLKIFRRISDDDVTFMGFSPVFSRPDWMICQALAVPPPAVRPSIKHDSQQRSEDDITHIIISIIKFNKILQEKIQENADASLIESWTTVLQYYVASLVNNKIPGAAPVAQRSGRPFKSIQERLNGKTGRVRGNLMGKRVDFSSRSVITGDPNLSIRELGVPLKIAMNLTYPVTTNERNRNYLMKLIRNGPDVYPGAKILERKTGESISLKYVDRESLTLNLGDIVHRHMVDGDAVLFNRQPTLHRMSMMCHIAKIMKEGNTFRMNVADTKPYNADYDGDEMNMHMPQDDESSMELRMLAAVPRQIVSPQNNASIVGIFQDSLLGSYRITRPDVVFTPRQAMNLLMTYPKVDTALFNDKQNISIFQVLSQILPPLTSKFKNGSFDDNDNPKTSNKVIEIVNGIMKRGQLDKGVKRLIHSIYNDFGYEASADFIDNLQNIVTEYMKSSAFSVGISDLLADEETNTQITQAITKKKQDVKNLIDQVQIGVFDNNTGKSNNEEFETCVNSILNKAQEEAGKIGRKSLDEDNRFKIMVEAGSKGSNINIAQMISCLGQQNVDGKRIPYGFEDRTLPHYHRFDDSPEARGFVESSFIQGLTPQELFFHAMGGRVGLIDTAVKTSETGYIQRRLIKGMEDLKVEYDMTVRNNVGKIIQYKYGDDNIDTVKVENMRLPLVSMGLEEIYAHYSMPEDSVSDSVFTTTYTSAALGRMKKQESQLKEKTVEIIDAMISDRDNIVKNVFGYSNDSTIHIPVHFERIITNIKNQLNIQSSTMVDITPLECFEMVEDCLKQLNSITYAKPTELFVTTFKFYLSPKEILMTHRFYRKALVILLETIVTNYKKSIVAPGEMVGMVAAQSIGEPTTQMTLNSFTYETPIIVRKNGVAEKIQIGDFVKQCIDFGNKGLTKMEYYSDKDTTYAPTLIDNDIWEIQAPNDDGQVQWYKIEAGTQHPVINEDGTNTMVKVTTENSQEIIATKAKSFLTLKNGKLEMTRGDEIKVGDYLPISTQTIDHTPIRILNLKSILSPTEYLYGSEAHIAMSYWDEPQWWLKYHTKEFTLPYKRSDSFRSRMSSVLRQGCNNRVTIQNGFVYPKKTWKQSSLIPENIELDYDFGYLLGAYAAEGCLTKTQISISNIEDGYFKPIERWCEKHNITIKKYIHNNKNCNGWTSGDIRIYSIILRDILEQLCGKLSHNKFIHNSIVFSNDECKHGFLNGYFGGDGSLCFKSKQISSCSTSYELLNDISVLLKTLGIYAFIRKNKKQITNNRGTHPDNIHQNWSLYVRNVSVVMLSNILSKILIKHKCDIANKLTQYSPKYIINRNETTIPNMIEGNIVLEKRTNMDDVTFVKIKSIEEVSNTTNYAYDLTVETTRNFIVYNGLAVADTFHFAGVSSKSNVTRGVPRIKEILSLSANPKNPSVTIALKGDDQYNKQKVEQMRHFVEHTSLRDIVDSVSICYDPDNLTSLIDEDKELITQYKMFEEMINECSPEDAETDEFSKWVIRFEMNKEEMLDKNITMNDVHFALENGYKDVIQCIFSDYNSDKLIFRVRLHESVTKKLDAKKKNAFVNDNDMLENQQKPLDQSDHIYMLNNLQENLLDNIVLRGVKNIGKVVMRKVQDNVIKTEGKYETKESWVLDTVGTNLLEILSMDDIDYTRTLTNDIIETYNILGIEAARQMIYNEIAEVIEFDGTYINYHHLALLCDRMCCNQKLVAISRHGINVDNIHPIAKASFEETPEMFLQAARHAEMDNMRGVSANVMVGQEGNFGTGSFQVVLDIKEMAKLGAKTFKQKVSIESQFGMEQQDDKCGIHNIKQTTNINVIQPKIIDDENDYNPGF